jgi:uncharacterized protein YdhG (YjbR/CyaY superfamily)
MAVPITVDEYIAGQPEARRAELGALRRAVNAAAPMATETIAYQMPALRLDGRFLVSYAAFKAHYSLFPASQAVIDALGDALTPYLAGMGTIRFPASEPLPLDLIGRVVEARLVDLRPA